MLYLVLINGFMLPLENEYGPQMLSKDYQINQAIRTSDC